MESSFTVVLISPYDLGRQPYAVAHSAAWLREDGFEVRCLDLSLERLDEETISAAGLVVVNLGMHTATRIALEVIPRIIDLAPAAHLCAAGLYAPMHAELLGKSGFTTFFGGEYEPELLDLARQLRNGVVDDTPRVEISLASIDYMVPDRSTLPPLERYAHLDLPDGGKRTVGFAETTRGCKYVCRHCPVVPIYEGRFRVVPIDIVLADIRQQVEAGAEHISFGDADFLNGPGHALRVVRALAEEFHDLSWDAVAKIQHLRKHRDLLPELARTGCLFLTSAVESVDPAILEYFDKRHTREDFFEVVRDVRTAGIALSPTFVPFTPWTTLAGYVELLETLVDLALVEAVPPVQLMIRLLVPQGSYLFKIPDFEKRVGDFEPGLLGYPWQSPEPRVDALQQSIHQIVGRGEAEQQSRREIFTRIWEAAHEAAGLKPSNLVGRLGASRRVPALSEPWYCCAEPTETQLSGM
jgi:radical SAM superfamily enzyme YgiQ (UPF0313 family)